jgi:hypothetical protein
VAQGDRYHPVQSPNSGPVAHGIPEFALPGSPITFEPRSRSGAALPGWAESERNVVLKDARPLHPEMATEECDEGFLLAP